MEMSWQWVSQLEIGPAQWGPEGHVHKEGACHQLSPAHLSKELRQRLPEWAQSTWRGRCSGLGPQVWWEEGTMASVFPMK